MNFAAIGNYLIAITVTVAITMGVMRFLSKGRVWKTFNNDLYKCGMVQMLSSDATPDLTGLYSSPTEASSAVLNCSSPQAFVYDKNLCTLKNGKYTCYPQPTNGQQV